MMASVDGSMSNGAMCWELFQNCSSSRHRCCCSCWWWFCCEPARWKSNEL